MSGFLQSSHVDVLPQESSFGKFFVGTLPQAPGFNRDFPVRKKLIPNKHKEKSIKKLAINKVKPKFSMIICHPECLKTPHRIHHRIHLHHRQKIHLF